MLSFFSRKRIQFAAIAGIALVAGASCGGSGGNSTTPSPVARPVLDATYRASGHAAAGDVFVHLFEWSWPAVATECETRLGPQGFKAVQISPPQEDITGDQWWTRYQPVSYGIDKSRSGTRTEFIDMVNRCKAAGVEIYADAVINHMTAGSGTGRNGTSYSKKSYPALYSDADFHSSCSISNYQDAANVQDCELVGLADLKTESDTVREKIASYLVSLSDLGVAGFRIDAAKHIQPVDLNAIIGKVNQAIAAKGRALPYYFLEVIDYGSEAVTARDYFGEGYSSSGSSDITEFKFRGIGDKFLGSGGQKLAQLNPNGLSGSQFSESAWGLMPSDKAVVFVENHDSQRNGGLWYRDGALYRLANVWMLAQPYGYPSVLSSFGFDRSSQSSRDAGPPPAALGCASSIDAAKVGEWVCEHRDASIGLMVAFRREAAGAPVANWWDNGTNAIGFSRGAKGFVAINAESAVTIQHTFATGLPAGSYCNILTGKLIANACSGQSVTVDSFGAAALTLAPRTAVVLQHDQLVR